MEAEPEFPPSIVHGEANQHSKQAILGEGVQHNYFFDDSSEGRGRLHRARVRAPIAEWNPFTLGVHAAIEGEANPNKNLMPLYVERSHDITLRSILEMSKRSGCPAMTMLTGGSCTGKTRSAYEAIKSCLPDLPLTFPMSAADLVVELADKGTPRVIWLNEAQTYLMGADGEQVAQDLRALLAGEGVADRSIVIIGTMWNNEYWQPLTRSPDYGARDPNFHVRQLLQEIENRGWRVDVPETFSSLENLKEKSLSDSRLREALEAAKGNGRVVQILAGGPQLIRRYDFDLDPYSKAVVTAAADAKRLGFSSLLPLEFLKDAASGYLDDQQWASACEDHDWFGRALAGATQPITKGRISLLAKLRPRARSNNLEVGYQLADFIEQHVRKARKNAIPPKSLWDAALTHAYTADDQEQLSVAAETRGLKKYAFGLSKKAADAGNPEVMKDVGCLLYFSGRMNEAEVWFRKSLEVGSYAAAFWLSSLLEKTDKGHEAELLLREAASSGDIEDLEHLADYLLRSGRSAEAEEIFLRAAEDGEVIAIYQYSALLANTERFVSAERWLRRALETGESVVIHGLTTLLVALGRSDEAVTIWTDAVEMGDSRALRDWAALLEKEGHIEAAEGKFREAVEGGDSFATEDLANFLERRGRIEEAEQVWRTAYQSGHPNAGIGLGRLLERTGRLDDARHWWQKSANLGDADAIKRVAWYAERDGRYEEAELLYRQSIEGGDIFAMDALVSLLRNRGRGAEAEYLTQFGISPGGATEDPW